MPYSAARVIATLVLIFTCWDVRVDYCDLGWIECCDSNSDWCLQYPSDWLTPKRAPTGVRVVFLDKENNERIRVSRTENRTIDGKATPEALRKLYQLELYHGYFVPSIKRKIVRSYIKGSGFSIYGEVGDDEFYLQVIAKGTGFCYAYIQFPGKWIKEECHSQVLHTLASSFR